MTAAIYILDESGKAQPTLDVQAWGRFMGSETARRVHRTVVNGAEVLTTFVGMSVDPTPLLWETVVNGGEHDGAIDRYTAREAAEAGHWRVVSFLRKAA